MQYCLVMKFGRDNYQPFDLEKLGIYNNENLTTLEGIDLFTSKFSNELELKELLYNANFIDYANINNDLKIIYFENGHFREEKYGVCYKEDYNFMLSTEFESFIMDNMLNSKIINRIYNEFRNYKDKTLNFDELIESLKNVYNITNNNILKNINNLDYYQRRDMCLFILNTFNDIINTKGISKSDVDEKRKLKLNSTQS